MFSQALRDIARPTYTEILEALKRSDGMAVSELAKELKMSYMGVKQHCVNLEKKGYLKTWRVPRTQVGRPEKLYRLTEACEELFPQSGPTLTLNLLKAVKKLYGESAPEKMLFHHFEDQRQRWAEKMKSATSLAEKASQLAELRDAEGCFSKCSYDPQTGLRIEEYHHSMSMIYAEYPNAVRMEVQMMEQLLGSRVVRKVVEVGKGRRQAVYEVASLGMPMGDDRGGSSAMEQRTGAVRGATNKVPTYLEM
ncbi:MAG: winged helix-turn-helix transcriptional regulator [Akkermansiaceae bacterium]